MSSEFKGSKDTKIKMYLLVNKDLKMGIGKTAGQVGHAVSQLTRILENNKNATYKSWVKAAEAKVVLKCSEKEILQIREKYKNITVEIRDAGKTQIPENSLTVVGFIPLEHTDVPDEVVEMKLL